MARVRRESNDLRRCRSYFSPALLHGSATCIVLSEALLSEEARSATVGQQGARAGRPVELERKVTWLQVLSPHASAAPSQARAASPSSIAAGGSRQRLWRSASRAATTRCSRSSVRRSTSRRAGQREVVGRVVAAVRAGQDVLDGHLSIGAARRIDDELGAAVNAAAHPDGVARVRPHIGGGLEGAVGGGERQQARLPGQQRARWRERGVTGRCCSVGPAAGHKLRIPRAETAGKRARGSPSMRAQKLVPVEGNGTARRTIGQKASVSWEKSYT
jgi:hypothetical protein